MDPHRFQSVFRIHDILVWIRIRGSMPLTNGSGFGSGSCYFCHWPSRCQQKTNFLTQFFLLCYFLKVHLHYFWKIKSHKESQNSRIQGFSYYFCMMIEGSGSGFRAGSGRPKNSWIRIRNPGFNADQDPHFCLHADSDPCGSGSREPNQCGSGSGSWSALKSQKVEKYV